nr:hypothetical protein CFP56_20704 [Quercus suber]
MSSNVKHTCRRMEKEVGEHCFNLTLRMGNICSSTDLRHYMIKSLRMQECTVCGDPTSGLKLPVRTLKRPPDETNLELRTRFNLLRLGFKLVHIPVRPKKSSFQKTCLGTGQPNIETCRQRH